MKIHLFLACVIAQAVVGVLGTVDTAEPVPARFNTSNSIHHHHEQHHPVEFLSHHAVEDRAQFVVNITRQAWQWYVAKRWGTDRGRTILAAMPTLWLMDLKEEFAKGREWVQAKLSNKTVLQGGQWVSNTVGEYVGALLSCYALTGDQLFMDKAKELADKLDSSYDFKGAVWDRPEIERPGEKKSHAVDEWARSRLEYAYLSRLTGDNKYLDRIGAIDKFLTSIKYEDNHLKVAMLAAKVKAYVQSNATKPEYLDDYRRSVTKAESVTDLLRTTASGLAFVNRGVGHMNDDDCQLGAILSLGADALQGALDRNTTIDAASKAKEGQLISRHRHLAARITETCHLGTKSTKSGLPPNVMQILPNETTTDKTLKGIGEYLFSPDLAESYLVLYRDTHDEKYRDWAWELTKSIFDNARTEEGQYAGVRDVQQMPTKLLSRRSSAPFFRGTLKYLFLIYSPEERLPLEQWVLTLAGHPLPVLDKKTAKRDKRCVKHCQNDPERKIPVWF